MDFRIYYNEKHLSRTLCATSKLKNKQIFIWNILFYNYIEIRSLRQRCVFPIISGSFQHYEMAKKLFTTYKRKKAWWKLKPTQQAVRDEKDPRAKNFIWRIKSLWPWPSFFSAYKIWLNQLHSHFRPIKSNIYLKSK